MNYKRHKPRKFARCKLCTPRKYVGNTQDRDAHGRGAFLNGARLNKRADIAEQERQ